MCVFLRYFTFDAMLGGWVGQTQRQIDILHYQINMNGAPNSRG